MKQPTASTAAAKSFGLLALMLFADPQGSSIDAFCPPHHGGGSYTSSKTAKASSLHLVPGQGKQLEAAFNAAQLSKKTNSEVGSSTEQLEQQQQQQGEPSSSSSHWRALSASRSFVTRLFHLPSNNIQHPHPTKEGLKDHLDSSSTTAQLPHGFPTFSIPLGNLQQQQQQKQQRSSQNDWTSVLSSTIINNDSKSHDAVLYPIVGFTFCNTKNDGCIALPTTSHASCRLRTNAQREEEIYGWYSAGCKLDLYSEDVCHRPTTAEDDAES